MTAPATEAAQSSPPAPDAAAKAPQPWTIDDATRLYNIDRWGQGYFSINDKGHVAVHPTRDPKTSIDLKNLVDELRERDLYPPILLRFTDILKNRLDEVSDAFRRAIAEFNYQGKYRCVYPIKVNQQRHVVEEILAFGRPHGFGVEAGSKPELLAVMAMVEDDQTPVLCNGFKDDEFIEAVILAAKIGKNVIPVVEKFSELSLIAKHAKVHDVKPTIGVRVKLSARGAGRWEASGGDRSKFGLFISEVVEAFGFLQKHDMADCLKLLHFHLGSQINDIQSVKNALTELGRVYVELCRSGAKLEYLDIGGGLGVDYDGSKTSGESSINYTLQEYANDVIYHIREICDQTSVPHPTIISESGRAMVAYHSLLVFNVLGWSGFDRFEVPTSLSREERKLMPMPVKMLFDTFHELTRDNFIECYHDAIAARDQVLSLFNLGYCTLQHRALAERLFYSICNKVRLAVRTLDEIPDEFLGLEKFLSDTYFCNYSIFQSMPDSWAIDQLFPIMPIHRLNEEPTCRGILADITCDSDGKVDHFIGDYDTKNVLELHPFNGNDYDLAAFLVGAYQEILGDMHNLFGDTHAVHVSLDEEGVPTIDEVIVGNSVQEVLQYVQYSPEELKRTMRKRVERALRDKKLTIVESRRLLQFYETGLEGYTYLE